MTYGSEHKSGSEIEIITTEGYVSWGKSGVVSKRRGEDTETTDSFESDQGVETEVAAFAEGISAGKLHPMQTAKQGLKDVELMQALLQSGEAGGKTQDL